MNTADSYLGSCRFGGRDDENMSPVFRRVTKHVAAVGKWHLNCGSIARLFRFAVLIMPIF
jgi:hypothetical protein